jgi:two-component system phosphate regulon response regulator PhoB
LRSCIERAGHWVATARTAGQAQADVDHFVPDLAILELDLPDMSGLELLQTWRSRERTVRMPVIVVSGRGDERERVMGLRAGADDCLCRPFSQNELLTRIERVLHHASQADASEVVEIDGLRIDNAAISVTAGDQPVRLGPLGFRMLRYLVMHPNRVHTREQIIDRVWRKQDVDPRAVYVQIRRLRALLERVGYANHIETVRGIGYRFTDRRHAALPPPQQTFGDRPRSGNGGGEGATRSPPPTTSPCTDTLAAGPT